MPLVPQALRLKSRALLPAALVVAGLALSACQNKTASLTGADQLATASTTEPAAGPSFKKTEEMAKAWEKDKANSQLGFAYAENLGRLGQMPAAAKVMRTVADANSNDAAIQAEAGKKLLGASAPGDAIAVLERAVQLNPKDWQSLSALGSAYDQKTQHGEARTKYQAALAINPSAVGVRNNLAMSHALQGQLPEAERLLRELMNGDGASNPKVRQNLALVVGLQGRFEEARAIASKDLPPDQVDANLAYLQQMLSQPNTWAQLQNG